MTRMGKIRWGLSGTRIVLLAMLAGGWAVACSDDDEGGGGSGAGGTAGSGGSSASGGTGGSTGGTGGSTGGTGGSTGGTGGSTGGTAGATGGSAGEAGDSGVDGSAGADASTGGTAGAAGSAGSGGSAGSSSADLALETNSSFGSVITGNAKSLYFYGRDLPGYLTNAPVSNCTGACLTTWPAFYGTPLNVGTGLDANDFSSFQRGDGTMQLTFKGWPVYQYAGDTTATATSGDGVDQLWHAVAFPFYDVVIMHKDPAADAAVLPDYLATGGGFTFYKYLSDSAGTNETDPVSTCTSTTCLANWARFTVQNPKLVSSLNANDFKVFLNVTTNEMQQAYKGYPMHNHKSDLKPGDTIGHGKVTNLWQVAGK